MVLSAVCERGMHRPDAGRAWRTARRAGRAWTDQTGLDGSGRVRTAGRLDGRVRTDGRVDGRTAAQTCMDGRTDNPESRAERVSVRRDPVLLDHLTLCMPVCNRPPTSPWICCSPRPSLAAHSEPLMPDGCLPTPPNIVGLYLWTSVTLGCTQVVQPCSDSPIVNSNSTPIVL